MGDTRSEVLEKGSRFTGGLDAKAAGKFWFLAWLAFLPNVIIRAENLAESDTFWQVRTGLLTMGQGRLPLTDPFSWTVQGKPWTLNSWAFNVLLGVAHEAAGLIGVALICAILVGTVGALVLYLARELGAAPVPSAVVLVAVGPLLTLYLSARPQLVDYIAVLALVIFLRWLVDGRHPRWSLLAIAVLTVLWVNLHAAALLGVAIAGTTVLVVFLKRSTRGRSGWLVAALLVISACSLLNPYGTGLLAQTLQVKAQSVDVTEWQRLNPADPLQLALFGIGVLGLGVAVRRRDAVFGAALAVAALGSISAMRILPILVLLALPVLASWLSRGVVLRYFASRRRLVITGAAVFLAVTTGAAVLNVPHFGRPDPTLFPSTALKAIPQGCKLFNEYHLGGLVILERPDVQVSLDSRNDLYGADLVSQSAQVLRGRADPVEGLAGADCVLVRPEGRLAGWLRTSPEWELASAESSAVLFLRR
jgi:hypothetical protein